jgi:hypothetical protein
LCTNWFTRPCLPKYLLQTSTNQISNSAINLSLFCNFILVYNVNKIAIICCPTKFQHGISSVSFGVGQWTHLLQISLKEMILCRIIFTLWKMNWWIGHTAWRQAAVRLVEILGELSITFATHSLRVKSH